MSVRTLDLRADPDADLSSVVEHVRRGGLIAYPTETVYGLGGACTPEAVLAVRRAKRRDTRALLALVPSRRSVDGLRWTAAAEALAGIFWPGALTLVLDDPLGIFPAGVRDETTGATGVRMTPHPVAARLIGVLGAPLTSTSLNEPGGTPAMSGDEGAEVLARLGVRDAWLLDHGTLPASEPSTVVDCTGAEPIVLREGSVPLSRLRCAIPEIHGRADA